MALSSPSAQLTRLQIDVNDDSYLTNPDNTTSNHTSLDSTGQVIQFSQYLTLNEHGYRLSRTNSSNSNGSSSQVQSQRNTPVTAGRKLSIGEDLTDTPEDAVQELLSDPTFVSIGDLSQLDVISIVGSGHSGIVKHCVDRRNQQSYALKVIRFNSDSEASATEIVNELHTLHHSTECAQIVRFHGACYKERAIHILLQYMDGGSLHQLLQQCNNRQRSPSLTDAPAIAEHHLAYIVHELLLALQYLHETLSILHRDVKPSNVLLSTDGSVALSDFGISATVDQPSQTDEQLGDYVNTSTGCINYLCPQRISGQPHSYASDIYSLGVTAVECLLGVLPYYSKYDFAARKDLGLQRSQSSHEKPRREIQPPSEDAPPANVGFWHLWQRIVNGESAANLLSADIYSAECIDFCSKCLVKDSLARPSEAELLQHPFITSNVKDTAQCKTELAAWLTAFQPVQTRQSNPAPIRTLAGQPLSAPLTIAGELLRPVTAPEPSILDELTYLPTTYALTSNYNNSPSPVVGSHVCTPSNASTASTDTSSFSRSSNDHRVSLTVCGGADNSTRQRLNSIKSPGSAGGRRQRSRSLSPADDRAGDSTATSKQPHSATIEITSQRASRTKKPRQSLIG